MRHEVKNYIFVASSGRCGTHALSKLFESIPGAISLHEPNPIMYDACPRDYNKDLYFKEQFKLFKLPNINKSSAGCKYYIETNHQFIKNFAKYAIEIFGSKIGIVHLIRNPIDTAISFYARDSIPGQNRSGMLWLINPKDCNNVIQVSDILFLEKDYSHDIYKCLWYWYETEARIEKLKQEYPGINYYSIKTSELNKINVILTMFANFNMSPDKDKLLSIIGKRFNKGNAIKKQAVDKNMVKTFNRKLLKNIRERYGNSILKGINT